MANNFIIRKMTVEDAATVHAIDTTVSSCAWSEKLYCDCMAIGYECWVACEDEQVIGFGVLSCAVNEAHILNLGIIPPKQGNGYGQQMLQQLLDRAKILGADEVFLEVRISNAVARALYKKFNFVEIGMRKDYYPPGGPENLPEDALTLALALR